MHISNFTDMGLYKLITHSLYNKPCPLPHLTEIFVKPAHAGLWLARAWFLEIVPVWTSVCVFVSVCVSAPEAINN